MKIIRTETLISVGTFANSPQWKRLQAFLCSAIKRVEWPLGSGQFTIYPQSGKKKNEGNGVKPIKDGLIQELKVKGWTLEGSPGKSLLPDAPDPLKRLDAILHVKGFGTVALEWETGNISSSHRTLNKMALGLLHGWLVCGILIVPTRNFAYYLTDRIGNMEELEPYLELWRSLPCQNGILQIIAVEHDDTSLDVPKIPKGTDGRARG